MGRDALGPAVEITARRLGPHGAFCLRIAPRSSADGRIAVLLPPFAEEMNRSRRMLSLQARALAAAGWDAHCLDLSGTGDSEGEFREARWQDWIDDVVAAVDAADAGGGPVAVLGLRLGAALAAEAARVRPDRIERLVLWQPVVNGETFLTQFLRLRMAAELGGQPGATTPKLLRASLAAGETVEIAGYELAGPLAAAIDGLRLVDLAPPKSVSVHWFEVASQAADAPSPAARSLIDAWSRRGVDVTFDAVVGEPFWSLQETTTVPDLVAATMRRLAVAAP